MRYRRLVEVGSLLGLTMICSVESCFANMVMVSPTDGLEVIAVILASFCVTVVVEFLVIYLLLGRPSKSKGWLFPRVLLIHFVSYPLAQVAFLFLFPPDLHTPSITVLRLCQIEALVVALEYLLLKRLFDSMHRIGKLGQKVNHGRTLKIAFAENMATFLFSIISWGLYEYLITILLLHTLPF